MTKRIEEVLNLQSLEELIGESNISDEDAARIEMLTTALGNSDPDLIDRYLIDPTGTREHAEEMDSVIEAALTVHKDAVDMAFNMEPKNAGSILEPAARFLELGMKAMQSKLDARSKGFELQMKREKLDAELKKNQINGNAEEVGDDDAPPEGVMKDRNELLRQMKSNT